MVQINHPRHPLPLRSLYIGRKRLIYWEEGLYVGRKGLYAGRKGLFIGSGSATLPESLLQIKICHVIFGKLEHIQSEYAKIFPNIEKTAGRALIVSGK